MSGSCDEAGSAGPGASQPSSGAAPRVGEIARVEAVEPRQVGDEQLRPAVGEDMRGLGAAQHGVDRDMHQPGARRGKRQDAGEHRLAHPARDAVAGGEAVREQFGGVAPDGIVELGISDGDVADGERRRIGRPAQREMVERVWRRVEAHPARLAQQGRRVQSLPRRAALPRGAAQ